MRVLFAVPYIYDKRYPEFTRNPTGFGLMTAQMYEYVSKENEAYLTSHIFTKGHGNILRHTYWDIIRHLRIRDIIQGIARALKYKQGFKERLKYFYYCVNKGYVAYLIKNLKPDIVHVNASGMRCKVFVEICDELHQKYLVTLHGLIGFDDSVQAPKWDKDYEKELLLSCEKKNIPVTVISTGMKKKIEKFYLQAESKSIVVITNGTNIEPAEESNMGNLREMYQIPQNGKIAVSVGNLCDRKNQIQIVETVFELFQKYNQEVYVFFCGRDGLNGKIQQRIEQLGLTSRVFALGFLSSERLKSIYRQADFNILASLDEGFGLSIIEAFVYGLPTVTFADLDAVSDLYDEKAMVLCENRENKAFAEAIAKIADTTWNAEEIKEYSKKFSLGVMAEKYQGVYKRLVES